MTARQPPPVTFIQLLHRAATHLRREIERQVLDPADLGWIAYEVLHTLLRGASHTPKTVGTAIGVPPPTLTAVIKRLADTDLIVRVPDLYDGRVVHLRLTRHGRSLAARLTAEVTAVEVELLGAVPADNLASVEPALRVFQPVEAER